MARHWVGTSGWSYKNWAGVVYPKGLKTSEWLHYYSSLLRSAEINNSFYRLPRQGMLETWVARTPDDFLFAVKAWRAMTHYRRLTHCEKWVELFFQLITPLGAKCGPVVFQLPPKFALDVPRLEAFIDLLPGKHRYAFEFRDAAWHRQEVYDSLGRRNVAFCSFEMGKQHAPRVATADFVYVRLHGRKSRYRGNYDGRQLRGWATWLKHRMEEGRDAYVYFDNTDEADYAVRNAERLDAMLRE